jgi:hypothetical protein
MPLPEMANLFVSLHLAVTAGLVCSVISLHILSLFCFSKLLKLLFFLG